MKSVWLCEIRDPWREFWTISVHSTEEKAIFYGKRMCTEEWEGYSFFITEKEIDKEINYDEE